MVEQTHITIRIPVEMLEQVEAHRRKLEQLNRQRVSRASAFRALIDAGLEAVEED